MSVIIEAQIWSYKQDRYSKTDTISLQENVNALVMCLQIILKYCECMRYKIQIGHQVLRNHPLTCFPRPDCCYNLLILTLFSVARLFFLVWVESFIWSLLRVNSWLLSTRLKCANPVQGVPGQHNPAHVSWDHFWVL